MDGLVLSVALGFRDYAMGMDAIAWITGFGGLATLYFTIFSLVRDAKTRKSIVAKQTTDHVANLESFLNGTQFEEMRRETEKIKETKMYFDSMSNEETDDEEQIRKHFNRWKGLYDKSLNFLGDLESTHHLIKWETISMNILNSCAGGRILLEYDEFFEPLLQSRAVIVKKLPQEEIYYGNTWSGIKRLTEELRELREKESQREKLLRVVAKLRSFRR